MRPLWLFVLLLTARAAWPQGNPVGPEFRVNTYTTDSQRAASVATDSSGRFIVVWASQQDGAYGVYGQRYEASGAPVGAEFLVSTYTTSAVVPTHQIMAPALASDASGNFVVVWETGDVDGSGLAIVGQRFASTGAALGPQFEVNNVTTGNQYQPAVAAAATGDFVVVWQNNPLTGPGIDIRGRRFSASGAPADAEFLVQAVQPGLLYDPAVIADAAGNFVVAWTDGFIHWVQAQRFSSSGAPLGNAFNVTSPSMVPKGSASAASDPTGNFVIAWESYLEDGSQLGIRGHRFASTGVPLGPEFRVNTFTSGFQSRPAVAIDASGNFVVVWHGRGSGDADSGIFGQRYLSSGAPLGSEFRINTYTTESQTLASVAADSTGNFVVVWTSDFQDGSGSGIYGQRFSEIIPVGLTGFDVE